MPQSPEPNAAQQAADDACAFYDRCIERGKSEAVANTLTTAYILGRLRQVADPKREPWEMDEE